MSKKAKKMYIAPMLKKSPKKEEHCSNVGKLPRNG
jgi:hypothetical protein